MSKQYSLADFLIVTACVAIFLAFWRLNITQDPFYAPSPLVMLRVLLTDFSTWFFIAACGLAAWGKTGPGAWGCFTIGWLWTMCSLNDCTFDSCGCVSSPCSASERLSFLWSGYIACFILPSSITPLFVQLARKNPQPFAARKWMLGAVAVALLDGIVNILHFAFMIEYMMD